MKKCSYCGKEYPDEMTNCPQDGQPLAAKPGTTPPPVPKATTAQGSATGKSTGLAITSLILGIFSMVCGCFFGLPAIICGHIALNRSQKRSAEFGGGGMATAGLVMGYIGIIFGTAVMAGLFLPALAKAKEKAIQIKCVNNLKQVGIAALIWSEDHNGNLPKSFLEMSNELANPGVLICPADAQHSSSSPGAPMVWNPNNITYEFLTPGVPRSNVLNVAIIRCPIHGTEVYGDGSVHMVTPRRQTN